MEENNNNTKNKSIAAGIVVGVILVPICIVIWLCSAIGGIFDGSYERSSDTNSDVETVCRALTEIFIENVVEEDYSIFNFSVEEMDLDEDNNGTIEILYLPSNESATKVNLTIDKYEKTYKIKYALLNGLDEVDLDTVSESNKVLTDE